MKTTSYTLEIKSGTAWVVYYHGKNWKRVSEKQQILGNAGAIWRCIYHDEQGNHLGLTWSGASRIA